MVNTECKVGAHTPKWSHAVVGEIERLDTGSAVLLQQAYIVYFDPQSNTLNNTIQVYDFLDLFQIEKSVLNLDDQMIESSPNSSHSHHNLYSEVIFS